MASETRRSGCRRDIGHPLRGGRLWDNIIGTPVMITPSGTLSRTLTRTLAAGAAIAALSIGAAASAQPAPPADAAGAAPNHEHFDREAMRAHMEARRQERLQTLHDALGLGAGQDNAWQTFVVDMRPPGGHDGKGRMGRRDGERPEGAAPMTTPERLDRMVQHMGERQAAMARRADAIKRFYSALSPTQQHTFDALARLRMGGMGGLGFGGGHGGPGHAAG